MAQGHYYDLTQASFSQIVGFWFDHEIVPTASITIELEPWYWHTEVRFEPLHMMRFYQQLFSHSWLLQGTFDERQLEQGFWAMQSATLECSVAELIWSTDVPLNVRLNVVSLMYDLYRDFFASNPLDTSVDMWWDSIAYDYCCGNRSRDRNEEDREMQDAMFGTLTRILQLPQQHCQYAALHGLGHLCHPDTEAEILRFLELHEVDDELADYAQHAARFDIL